MGKLVIGVYTVYAGLTAYRDDAEPVDIGATAQRSVSSESKSTAFLSASPRGGQPVIFCPMKVHITLIVRHEERVILSNFSVSVLPILLIPIATCVTNTNDILSLQQIIVNELGADIFRAPLRQ